LDSAVSPSTSAIRASVASNVRWARSGATGVGDERVRQPEPLGDRERLRAAGQADRQR
jgi:hypothetical protein